MGIFMPVFDMLTIIEFDKNANSIKMVSITLLV